MHTELHFGFNYQPYLTNITQIPNSTLFKAGGQIDLFNIDKPIEQFPVVIEVVYELGRIFDRVELTAKQLLFEYLMYPYALKGGVENYEVVSF